MIQRYDTLQCGYAGEVWADDKGEWVKHADHLAALAAAEARAERAEQEAAGLRAVIRWALGEEGEFPDEPEPIAGKYRQRYWWRSELRKRAEAARAGGGK